jgi:hypothetical protein
MTALAFAVDRPEDAPFYKALADKGARYLDEKLFNGEYYEQKVEYQTLRNRSFADYLTGLREPFTSEEKLLLQEGPKYQYGTGCISDGVIGAWLAGLCGLQSPQNEQNVRQNLQSIFDYNFRTSLWEHANPQRPGYAWGDEPGLLLCTWPHGGKPTLPFVYSDEVWTGIEYQTASHMISVGLVDEGLTIVNALRSRHNGHVRNPWNEYECGSYYARAMASYALLVALAGFRYSAETKTLWLAPCLDLKTFQTFFSTAGGWGTLRLSGEKLEIEIAEGRLQVDEIRVQWLGNEYTIRPGMTVTAGSPKTIELS